MDELALSQPEKQVMAKTLLDLNFSATEIAETLGIHRATVYRYSDKPIPADLLQFATEIKVLLTLKQQGIVAKILKRIDILVERSLDLRTLIVAFEVIKKHTGSLYDIEKQKSTDERWLGLLRKE
jgi:predicted transcriptional regulator